MSVPMAMVVSMTVLGTMSVLVGVLVHPKYSTSLLASAQLAERLVVIGKYDNSVPRIR